MGRWRERARELHADDPQALGQQESIRAEAPTLPLAPLADDDPAVLWRVALLRSHIAPTEPIVLPPVRAGVPLLVAKDGATGALVYGAHCGSCGEPREEGQRFHCCACQHARALVVNEAREGVPIPRALDETSEDTGSEAKAPSQGQQQPSEPAA